jgi:hypothetical protein
MDVFRMREAEATGTRELAMLASLQSKGGVGASPAIAPSRMPAPASSSAPARHGDLFGAAAV